jgi:CBS-domain-containing membrane protein
MHVEEAMTKNVVCCEASDTLDHAAQLMWTHDCGCLPVCSHDQGEHHALGVITDRDICMCALFRHEPLSSMTVGQAMAKQLQSCRPSDSLLGVHRVMSEMRLRRLPVLDRGGNLIGMITLSDLARRSGPEFTDEAQATSVKDTLAMICEPSTRVAMQTAPGEQEAAPRVDDGMPLDREPVNYEPDRSGTLGSIASVKSEAQGGPPDGDGPRPPHPTYRFGR